jgi:hypothetical protein
MKKSQRTVSVFLLGSGQNLVGQNKPEQEAKIAEILNKFRMKGEDKFLIREEADFGKTRDLQFDALLVFACCQDRFAGLVEIAERSLPIIIVGEGEFFSNALDIVTYLADHPNVSLALSRAEVRYELAAIRAAIWVKTAKIIAFNMENLKPEEAATWKNPITLHSLNVVHVKPDRLIETYRNTDTEKAERLAKEWADQYEVREPKLEDIVRSARAYLALKAVMKEAEADVVYVPWCGMFTKPMETKLCFAMAKLADDGIPVGCWRGENLLPMLILHAVTHKPVFIGEIDRHKGKNVTVKHCFCPTRLSAAKPVLHRWRSMKGTVTAYCQLPKGAATLVNGGIGNKTLITKVNVLGCQDLGNKTCRMTLTIQLPDESALHKLQGPECALVYGDCTRQAEDTAKMLGIQVL